jgi:hypothetical protein
MTVGLLKVGIGRRRAAGAATVPRHLARILEAPRDRARGPVSLRMSTAALCVLTLNRRSTLTARVALCAADEVILADAIRKAMDLREMENFLGDPRLVNPTYPRRSASDGPGTPPLWLPLIRVSEGAPRGTCGMLTGTLTQQTRTGPRAAGRVPLRRRRAGRDRPHVPGRHRLLPSV